MKLNNVSPFQYIKAGVQVDDIVDVLNATLVIKLSFVEQSNSIIMIL